METLNSYSLVILKIVCVFSPQGRLKMFKDWSKLWKRVQSAKNLLCAQGLPEFAPQSKSLCWKDRDGWISGAHHKSQVLNKKQNKTKTKADGPRGMLPGVDVCPTTTIHAPGMMVRTCSSCDSSAREGEMGDPWGWLAGLPR